MTTNEFMNIYIEKDTYRNPVHRKERGSKEMRNKKTLEKQQNRVTTSNVSDMNSSIKILTCD